MIVSKKTIIIGLIVIVAATILYAQQQFNSLSNDKSPVMEGDYQTINMIVDGIDYKPSEFTVIKGHPVKFIVDGSKAQDCVQYFTIPLFGISTKLKQGENVFTFTPQQVGDIPFSCTMNMARGVIHVVASEDATSSEKKDVLNQAFQQQETFLPKEVLDVKKLSSATPSIIIPVSDGETISLTAGPVSKKINGQEYIFYGYNSQIPGPLLRVEQSSMINVTFTNNLPHNTTIHWHGLRHDIQNDGVPGISQEPIQPGETFKYTLSFPDAGMFWYHPHIREDIQQELGLYGNILVTNQDYFNLDSREEYIALDDVLVDGNDFVPFGKNHANYAIMGRFGNVMLINGETTYNLTVHQGEIVRFFVTNVANVRPFNISIAGLPQQSMKLIGSDLSLYEHDTFVDNIVVAPAERYIIEVYFDKAGEYTLIHNNPHATYILGTIKVLSSDAPVSASKIASFKKLSDHPEMVRNIAQFKPYFGKEPDYELHLLADMPSMQMMGMMDAHQEELIEWEDTMKMMNARFTSKDVTWQIKDEKTGLTNMDFVMAAKVGDKVKIRIVNDKKSMHPMQHPIHLHGQRFLVLNQDGIEYNNLVWKDTVLIPRGSTVDILVDVTNPGEWMFHCHIAEHLESGMMSAFVVE